jgi:hypothetical protein
MHLPLCADDRINRTGRQTAGTTDAAIRIDVRHHRRAFTAALGIQREFFGLQQACQLTNGGVSARGATIDCARTGRDRFSIGSATLKATARALSLRQ